MNLSSFFLLKPPSERPEENRSFDNLVKYYLNPLVHVQLHLFKDMATILNGCLVNFQTDSPMVPFLSLQIGDILHRLMLFFVPKHVLKTANSPLKLQQIDVQKSENIVGVSQIKLSTGAASVLEKVPSKLHDGLKKGFLKFLQVMIKKIQEKSPVKYKLVRNAACLNPVVLKHYKKCLVVLLTLCIRIKELSLRMLIQLKSNMITFGLMKYQKSTIILKISIF